MARVCWVPAEEYGDIREVATLIRDLHRLQQPDDLELPELNPFARADTRLDGVCGLESADVEFQRAGLADARAKWDELERPAARADPRRREHRQRAPC